MSDQTPEDTGPKVLDLQAEEIKVEAETPAFAALEDEAATSAGAEAPPPPPPAPKRKSGGASRWIIAALILGALGGGWLYRDLLSPYLPSDEMKALTAKVGALEVNNSNLADQVAGLQQTAQSAAETANAAKDAGAATAEQAGKAAQGVVDLDSKLQSTDQRLSAAEAAIQSAAADLDSFRKSISASGADAGSTPIGNAALAALAQRLDALEKDMASLKSGAGVQGQANVTAALSQALADLKAKVAAGTPYAAESDRISRMVPAAAGLDTVTSYAANGVPNPQQLAAELRGLIPSLPAPAAPPAEDNSYFGALMKSLSGIVTIREIGDADWRQVAEKAAAFAEAGDLPQAIATVDTAEGDKPLPLTQWRGKAEARLQLDAGLEKLSEAVMRQITALGGAQ